MARKRADTPTLSLFGSEEPAGERATPQVMPGATSAMKWSYSRRNVLEQCPRRFYYYYYGANKRRAKNDDSKERLYRLKLAVNRHTRTGDILHLVIADYLRKAQQGTPWERENLLSWARKIFGRDLSRSREGLETITQSYQQHPPLFLVEFLQEAEPRQLCREAENEMVAALQTFLDAPAFAPIRELGIQSDALIEKHFHRLGGFPFAVEGQVDLAHCSLSGLVTVVDWKSGEDVSDGDDSLQLAVYALWAKEAFSCKAEDIKIFKAFLGNGSLVEFPLSDDLLKIARLKILQDAEFFARMHEYGCAGIAEAFTPCAQEAVCRGCSFATTCPEGKESIA
jgi:hypothetical protein